MQNLVLVNLPHTVPPQSAVTASCRHPPFTADPKHRYRGISLALMHGVAGVPAQTQPLLVEALLAVGVVSSLNDPILAEMTMGTAMQAMRVPCVSDARAVRGTSRAYDPAHLSGCS
jgi:hypothetical protein